MAGQLAGFADGDEGCGEAGCDGTAEQEAASVCAVKDARTGRVSGWTERCLGRLCVLGDDGSAAGTGECLSG